MANLGITYAALAVVGRLVNIFGPRIESDQPINGADAVDDIVQLYQDAKAVVKSLPQLPQAPRVVVFASDGVIRAVAVQGLPAPKCVVVNYDELPSGGVAASPEAFERGLLGCTRLEFDRAAQYIW